MAVKPVRVSQLNGYIKRVLSTDPLLGNISVIGEISNIKYHESGHVYFSMKDASSKINCFLPSDIAADLRYELDDGMEITASGFIYLYERGGTYSLNIRDVIVSGQGGLAAAFEILKEKSKNEGLFDPEHKKSLPVFHDSVALVTSGSGAALEDMLKIITSKNNFVDILIYPVLVQGEGAAKDISAAINEINDKFPKTDIIIVGRGGGPAEELWAFNEEIVARSIYNSKIPVISAVGHETDVTISDFAADVRAETPTAAAQMAVPDISALRQYADSRLDALFAEADRFIQGKKHQIDMHKVKLDSLNPSHIMSLGYGAVLDKNGNLISTVSRVKPNDSLTVIFSDGEAACRVEEVKGGLNAKE